MRRYDESVDGVHELGDLVKRREGFFDVRRPTPAEGASERVVHIDTHATLDQDPGDVGAAQRPSAPRPGGQLDRRPEGSRLSRVLLGAPRARRPRAREERLETRVARREEIAE